MYTELVALASPWWDDIKGFANSSFTTSLAGAFAGAIAAQRIAEKGKFREELLKEFHHTNAAISLAMAAACLGLALKKQHIKALKSSYDEDIKNFEIYKSKKSAGQLEADTPYEIHPNLLVLQDITPPIAVIQDIVLSKLSTAGRTISATTALSDSIVNLNGAISKRNELLNSYKNNQFPEGAKLHHLYLGLPYGDGNTNQEYGGTVLAIALYTDDVIFFSVKLCEDLMEHGEALKKRYRSRLRGRPPRISAVDFEVPRQNGLIPNDAQYEPWLSGFNPAPEDTVRWWQRINPFTWFN